MKSFVAVWETASLQNGLTHHIKLSSRLGILWFLRASASASMPLGLQDGEEVTKVLIFTPGTDEVILAPVWIGSILTGKALDEIGQLCGLRRVRASFECSLLQEQLPHVCPQPRDSGTVNASAAFACGRLGPNFISVHVPDSHNGSPLWSHAFPMHLRLHLNDRKMSMPDVRMCKARPQFAKPHDSGESGTLSQLNPETMHDMCCSGVSRQ